MFRRAEKVFISHSSKNKDFVRKSILPQVKLARRDYWYDAEDIKGGDNYRQELLKGILDECDRLLVVVSKEALGSDWVKEELAVATKDILARRAKIDARLVHRRILPVKIDERDEFGEKVRSDRDVDLFMLHPYLTLVNYIEIPHNAKLDRTLDKYLGKKNSTRALDNYLEQELKLTKEQRESVKEYHAKRNEKLKNLETALRNPDSLRWDFKPFGRLVALLVSAPFQRVALALFLLWAMVTLAVAPFAARLLVSKYDLPMVASLLGQGEIPNVEIQANGVKLIPRPSGTNEVIPVHLNDGLMVLLVHAEGQPSIAHTIRPQLPQLRPAVGPTAEPPEIRIEIEPVGASSPAAADNEENASHPFPQALSTYVSDETNTFQPEASGPRGNRAETDVRANPNATRKVVVHIRQTPDVEVREIPAAEVSTDELVLRIRATAADGKQAEKYVEFVPASTAPASPEIEIAKVRKDGTMVENYAAGGQVLNISVSNDAAYLLIRAKNEHGHEAKRYVNIQRDGPTEIEIKTARQVSGSRVDGDLVRLEAGLKGAHQINMTYDPTVLLVRAKTNDGQGAWRYVRLRPPEKPKPAVPEIEVARAFTNDKVDKSISVAGGTTSVLHIKVTNDNRTVTEKKVAIIPQDSPLASINITETSPDDGELREAVANNRVGSYIARSGEPTFLRISATTASGENVEFVRLQSDEVPKPRPVPEKMVIQKLVDSDATVRESELTLPKNGRVPPRISLAGGPSLWRIRATATNGEVIERDLQLLADVPDRGPPEIEIRKMWIDDGRWLGQPSIALAEARNENDFPSLSVSEDPKQLLLIRALGANGQSTTRYVHLLADVPEPSRPEITFDARPPARYQRSNDDPNHFFIQLTGNTDLAVRAGDGPPKLLTLIPPPPVVPEITFQTSPQNLLRRTNATNQYLMQLTQNTDLGIFVGGDLQKMVKLVSPPPLDPVITIDTLPPPPRTIIQQFESGKGVPSLLVQLGGDTELRVYSGGRLKKVVRLLPPQVTPRSAPVPYREPVSVDNPYYPTQVNPANDPRRYPTTDREPVSSTYQIDPNYDTSDGPYDYSSGPDDDLFFE